MIFLAVLSLTSWFPAMWYGGPAIWTSLAVLLTHYGSRAVTSELPESKYKWPRYRR